MKLVYPSLAAALVLCFGASSMGAQVEVSAGFGVHASRLVDRSNHNVGFGPRFGQRTFANPGVSATVAYRPNERFAVRGVASISEREVSFDFNGLRGFFGNSVARSADFGLEAAYYPSGWFSIGAGGGVAYTRSRGPGSDPFGRPMPAPTFTGTLVPQSFGFANLALEAYAGLVTLRVAPYVSLTDIYDPEVRRFIINGQPNQQRGNWLGLNATVMVRAPFGKTRYGAPITFDSLLDRTTGGLADRMPRWGVGFSGSVSAPIATLGASPRDGHSPGPAQQRFALQFTYALDDDWRLRGSLGINRLRSYTDLSTEEQLTSPQSVTNFKGVDLMVGAERRVWRELYVAADFGPLNRFNRFTSPVDQDGFDGRFGSAGDHPLAQVIWYSNTQAFWQTTDRLRLGAQVGFTLNDAHGSEPDQRIQPARDRDGRWLSLGATASYLVLKG